VGRLLKVDDCTIAKVRLDYARLLVTTKMMGEISVVEEFWVDEKNNMISVWRRILSSV
jgi:hypothetical protein